MIEMSPKVFGEENDVFRNQQKIRDEFFHLLRYCVTELNDYSSVTSMIASKVFRFNIFEGRLRKFLLF
jgi:hypothetical protein